MDAYSLSLARAAATSLRWRIRGLIERVQILSLNSVGSHGNGVKVEGNGSGTLQLSARVLRTESNNHTIKLKVS